MTTARRVVATLLFAAIASPTLAVTAVWIGPETGDWTDPTNWSTGQVPIVYQTAIIDNDESRHSQVFVSDPLWGVGSLTIDYLDTLILENFSAEEVHLAGEFVVLEDGRFDLRNNLDIEETGHLEINGIFSSLYKSSSTGNSIWNRGSIDGAGVLELSDSLRNDGTLSVNGEGKHLSVTLGNKTEGSYIVGTNGGLIQATSGGSLLLSRTFASIGARLLNYQDSTPGRIEALAGSSLTIRSLIIEGGVVSSEVQDDSHGNLLIEQSQLDGVQLEGEIDLKYVTLTGAVQNLGQLNLTYNCGLLGTLSGGGVVQFAHSSITYNTGYGRDATFVNEDNVLRGQGTFESGNMVNRGTIETGFGTEEPVQLSDYKGLVD
ncbi:hypothetical protein [Aeoliella mucimassa]|uniref:Autotransporter-associated beta strand repeat protein n=1 Tax=Aeoliella mucimassa TaxID=2527972 RepID=A0A518AWK1_9BACT|nr:hypothetical protein [Aeoliella mucimassa]QDU59104.1 hypothetical protein Pan181_53450 [Aeoliella mucimassa]